MEAQTDDLDNTAVIAGAYNVQQNPKNRRVLQDSWGAVTACLGSNQGNT